MSQPITIGLIGASNFGKTHLAGFQASPHVGAIYLAGRDRQKLDAVRAEFSKVHGVTTDYRTLFSQDALDLVDIVLPHDMHLPVALEAFRAGKHVLVEKPPARTCTEFRTMRAAAQAADRRLFVVLNLVYTATHRAARAAIDAGRIGTPFLSVEVSLGRARYIYENPADWRADRERSGGGLQIDGGFHAVYRQLYLLEALGAPLWVMADCDQIGVTAPTKGEDFSALTLAYPGGARIHLMSQWTGRAPLGRFPSGILGDEGSLVFTGDRAQPLLIRREDGSEENVEVPIGPEGFSESATACAEHIAACLADGSEPYAGVDLAALTLEVVTGAYRSAAEGRRIPLSGRFRTGAETERPPLEECGGSSGKH